MANQTCYWPSAYTADGVIPCSSGSGSTQCCYPGHYCWANGLCMDPSRMTFYRGGCTDRSFNSAVCGPKCLNYNDRIEAVWVCNDNRDVACGSLANCGYSGPQGTVPASSTAPIGGVTVLPVIVGQSALNSASSPTSSASDTTGSASGSSSTFSASSPSQSSSCPSQIPVYAGLGVLGAVLLIALLLLGFFYGRYRTARKGRQHVPTSDPQTSQMPPNYRYTQDYQQVQPHGNSISDHDRHRHELGSSYARSK